MFVFITSEASAEDKYIEVCRYIINIEDVNYVGKHNHSTLLKIGFNGGELNISCPSSERDKEFERVIYLLKKNDVSFS